MKGAQLLSLSDVVLVVEDDEILATLERSILEEEGLATHWARTGQDALRHLRECRPRLVVLDFSLGDMTGLEVVRAHQPMPPFIVATGVGDERIAVELMKLGARDYLVKDAQFVENLPMIVRRILRDLDQEARLARAELELEESRARLAFALEATGNAYFEVDLTSGEGSLSEGMLRRLGYAPAEVAFGPDWWKPRIHPEDREGVQERLAQMLTSDEAFELEYRFASADGSYRWILDRARVGGRNAEGAATRLTGIWTDVTERRRAEAALRDAEKAESLTLMAAGIAHDFNNRFQTLLSNLELAQIGLDPTGRPALALQRAQVVLRESAQLAARILEFTGRSFRRPERLDPRRVLQEQATDLVALAHDFPQARLRIAPVLEVPPVEGDPLQLAQVLRAIVQNGLEALEGPGEVEVTLSIARLEASDLDTPTWVELPEPGLHLCVEVRDNGAGMSPETLVRVGDPFFSTKADGRGMSIPAARGILRGHGGGLWLASEPGVGTTVRAYFPAAEGTPSRELPPLEVAAAPPPKGRLILLVDDEADLREAISEVLTDVLGFEVIQASDGVEGLEAFRARADEIALVLMDAKMPRMGGTEAFQAMKQLRPGARALLCSGYGEEFGLATAQTYGFLGFLKKPFGIATLKEAIEQALSA